MAEWNDWKLTIGLIAFCVLVALMTGFGDNSAALSPLWINDPDSGPGLFSSVLNGEVWRLLTPMLIHFGAMHLFFNMYWLWELGRIMEAREGVVKYGLAVAVIGIASSILQYVVVGPYFGGMSGVVYGLIGYFWARGKFEPMSRYHLSQNDFFIAIAWFAAGWTGILGPIANWAHAGGLVLGLALGFADARGGYVRRPGQG